MGGSSSKEVDHGPLIGVLNAPVTNSLTNQFPVDNFSLKNENQKANLNGPQKVLQFFLEDCKGY